MTVKGVEDVIRNLERWRDGRIAKAEQAGKNDIAPMLETYAKQNRPWKDRTGNARRGLHSKVVVTAKDIAIQWHHGVHYGLYLELSRAGKYAILRPTIDRHRAEIVRILKSALGD